INPRVILKATTCKRKARQTKKAVKKGLRPGLKIQKKKVCKAMGPRLLKIREIRALKIWQRAQRLPRLPRSIGKRMSPQWARKKTPSRTQSSPAPLLGPINSQALTLTLMKRDQKARMDSKDVVNPESLPGLHEVLLKKRLLSLRKT